MGVLGRGDSQHSFELSTVTRVGRDPENELVVLSPGVSQFHAVVRWAATGRWEVRDLGSTNGTFVDGELLKPGTDVALRAGVRLVFGRGGEPWTVVSATRPLPEARDVVSGERIFGTPHLLSLAAPHEDPLDILEERVGSWVLERGSDVAPVRSGQLVVVGGRTLRVSLPLPAPETEETSALPAASVPGDALGHTSLSFFVSADLESVTMSVRWNDEEWECQRAYNRALVELAKARLRDQSDGRLPPLEHGWVYGDELCSLADFDGLARLNVEIHRARSDLARRGVPNAPAIVQRRKGTGQLRIGTARVQVVEPSQP
ncbi:MAG: FHA domain-containing protein [Polyangiaceae bacterium]|jgi:hypothetical protein|nr:FHA domain-containing protein [Polyangiaceae bacterium]MBK8937414.1 FHA domain-containing protein [Polyangiaceae bacterium]